MPIKSFRGKMTSGTIDVVSLHTNNGSIGYRIKKMQIIPADGFGTINQEFTMKVYSVPQTTVDDAVDFSDQTLLAAGYIGLNTSAGQIGETVVFDNMTFNQDIYITMIETAGNAGNYYIELEQVKLSLDENTVSTLKDIRNIEASKL